MHTVVPLLSESTVVNVTAVLAAGYVWLLGSAASDHGWLWDQLLPLSETELEPYQQAPCTYVWAATYSYCVTRNFGKASRLFNGGLFTFC